MNTNRGECCNVLFSLCGDKYKASSRVRGFWIAEELKQLGVKCSLSWGDTKYQYLKLAIDIFENDVIIFQKTYTRYHRWLIWLAKTLGKLTYVDLDDAPSKNKSPRTMNNIESMIRMADGVFVGSNNLYKYAEKFQRHVYLIPSGVNINNYRILDVRGENEFICLGWIGNGAQYKNDLIKILEKPLKTLAAQFRIRFKIIGACGVKELYKVFGSIPNLEIDFYDSIDWSDSSEVSDSMKDIDIGLYPLLVNEFNNYKCGFKAIEYMASGIPVVSSNVAENADIICHDQDGMLVNSEEQWVSVLDELIRDPDKRNKMGMAGRIKVEKQYNTAVIAKTIESIIHKNCLSRG